MSELNASLMSLADWTKRRDPDGRAAKVVELLEQTNDILLDMPFREGNLPTGHQTTVRTGLPSPQWSMINEGVPVTKSRTGQVTETVGYLEDRSSLDVRLAKLGGDLETLRMEEAKPHVEGINQELASTLFYGNTTINPEEFDGLAPRYNSLSGAISQNVIDGGGSGSDNSSIWLIVWGDPIFGIFPKGSNAGIDHEDLGIQDEFDGTNRYRAYMDHWQITHGLTVRDWRFVVRIANIDISVLIANSSPANLRQLMIKATHRIPNLRMGKARFYMNRTVFQFLDIQRLGAVEGAGMTFKDMEVDGKNVPSFRGIPVRTVDALTEGESAVS